jgi:flagellar protein FliS
MTYAGTTSASDRYLEDRVLTASPAELTAMLYDALSASARGAITRLEAGDRQGALPRIQKAQDILLELRVTLDHSAGPLAGQLDALYTFAWRRLLDAVVHGDPAVAREALDVIEPLRTAWRQACLQQAA